MDKSLIRQVLTWHTLLIVSAVACTFIIPALPVAWEKIPMRIGFTGTGFTRGFFTYPEYCILPGCGVFPDQGDGNG
jgi:hypothetical protein